MSDNSANSKRIAKNALALYFRMFLTMAVGLFTSRVILDSLGVEDFGIYNLVGGFVAMFNIVRAGLLAATQRFITYDLGKGDKQELNRTFSTCVIIFLSLAILIVVLAELPGIWFVNNKLAIPEARLGAAHWVFQLSLITLIINLVSYPYNALIVAHEHMKAFAYISIFEAFAKLAVAYALYISSFDKLILYAILLCLIQVIVRMMYNGYCRKHFEESKVSWTVDWSKIKQIYSFTGWELFGSIAVMGYTQGLNVLLGMFFTPVVNAARGVAVQVQSVIVSFVSSFQTALNPQITKSFAKGDTSYNHKLLFTSSRFSFYLLFLIALPVILEAEELLDLWLVEVPEYTVTFFRLIILTTMIDAISNPIITAVEATGKIKIYQIVVGSILLMILPVAYVVLRLGGAPYSVFMVHVVMSSIAFIARLIMGSKQVGFKKSIFMREVLLPISMVIIASIIVPTLLHFNMCQGIVRLLVVGCVSVITTGASVFVIGLHASERQMAIGIVKKFVKRS